MNFLYPVPATSIVTQTFAQHVHAAKVNNWTNYNGGIDWAVDTGTPVVATQAGRVTDVRRDATGYGTHVRIQHDGGYLTIYGHLMDTCVKVGDRVEAGQQIGRSDSTGNSTGPHLHFELRRNNVPVDPAPLLTMYPEPANPPAPEEPVQPAEPIPAGELVRVTADLGLRIRLRPNGALLGLAAHNTLFQSGGEAIDGWQPVIVYVSADWVEKA